MRDRITAAIGCGVLLIGLILWGIATREPIEDRSLGIVVLLSIAGLIWAKWQRSREDYVEHPDDKYHTVFVIGAFVIFILTGSWLLWMFGGVLLIATVKMIRGED